METCAYGDVSHKEGDELAKYVCRAIQKIILFRWVVVGGTHLGENNYTRKR